MTAWIPILGPLLVKLLGLVLPRGEQQAREPSTAIGVTELAAALELFHLSHDMAGAVAALAVALLGVVNVYRREHPAPPALPAPASGTDRAGPPA